MAFRAGSTPAEAPEEQAGKAVGVAGALGELGPALSDGDSVDGELFFVAVEGELEAVGQRVLQHAFELLAVGTAFGFGLGENIV